MDGTPNTAKLAHNVKRLSHLDLPGAGQVYVAGNYAYTGHLPNKEQLGTSILDVSDPRKPRIVSQIFLDDPHSHSHKARVIGDLMIVNSERNMTAIGRKADELPKLRAQLRAALGRDPDHAELAAKLGVKESDIPAVEEAQRKPYDQGGFKTYDVSDKTKPRLISFQKTHGIGVHRFDMDANYAYISTEMPGYIGNILVIYDIRNPARPAEISRWWLPGQHLAGGEKPTWSGRQHRLHHTLRVGDRLWAGCWHGGVRVIDVSDIRQPRTIGEYNYHPPFPEPSHTFMGVPFAIDGKQIALAIDEEDHAHSAEEMARRRGRPHGCLWVFDVTDLKKIQPLAIYEVSELDSPWSRAAPGRFGAHQFQEHMQDTLVYCAWFAGGLRIVDIADPLAPREVGYFIPEPAQGRPCPQTNDVDVDERGLIYLVDRYAGFDILELNR
jgi:hypothetical protein